MHNGLSIPGRMRLAPLRWLISIAFVCLHVKISDFRFSGPWDILKSRTALDCDLDGECTYENFGHLYRG
jgi:hypothetical protein